MYHCHVGVMLPFAAGIQLACGMTQGTTAYSARSMMVAMPKRRATLHARRHERKTDGVTARAMRALLHHSWPGNIRELENLLERGIILAQDGELIDTRHLFSVENRSNDSLLGLGHGGLLTAMDHYSDEQSNDSQAQGLDILAEQLLEQGSTNLGDLEQALACAALRKTKGNISKAAKLLGLTRAQLDYKVKQPGLPLQ